MINVRLLRHTCRCVILERSSKRHVRLRRARAQLVAIGECKRQPQAQPRLNIELQTRINIELSSG